jgi:hypothetical protein
MLQEQDGIGRLSYETLIDQLILQRKPVLIRNPA